MVVKGLRNKEIAEVLGISPRPVKASLADLFLIFDVCNRTELAGLSKGAITGDRLEWVEAETPATDGKGASAA
jgi:hypothetical protein